MVEQFKNKTVPQSRNNGGPVSNSPDRPRIERTTVGALHSIFDRRQLRGSVSVGVFESRKTVIEPDRYHPVAKGIKLIPVTVLPLTPVFLVEHGGGRVYGGGTSPEALRRAKRKAKR